MRTKFLNFLILALVALVAACNTSTPEDNPPEPPVIHVTGISFDVNRVELTVGESYSLKVTVSPENASDKSFTIESDETSTARVDANGNVSTYSEGVALIKATTTDGGFEATCRVVVNEEEQGTMVHVTSVVFDKSTLTLEEEQEERLTYKVYPSNANNQTVRWTIKDENIASVNNGVVKALNEGKTDITITSVDGGCESVCKLTVTKKPIDPDPDPEDHGEEEEEDLPEINYVKVFAYKEEYSYVYAWSENSGNVNTITKSWPGDQMSSYDNEWNTYDFDVAYTSFNLIFNVGSSQKQTGNLAVTQAGYYWCYNNRLYNKKPSEDDPISDLPQGNFEVVSSAKDYTELPAVKDYNKGLVINPYTGVRTDFRQESIYFAMTTRFYDGDASNNRKCWANNNANDPEWRGDFKGLIQKMDYIKALGFTAIWITPVVKNASGYDYHGYHAINFSQVDPRYESEDVKFADVIKEAHKRDMKIVLDVVFNHTSNLGEENLFPMFTYDSLNGTQNGISPSTYYSHLLPSNYTSLNGGDQFQARIQAMKTSSDAYNIYHHEMSMAYEQYIEQTGSMAGDCIDLNTENPTVANYLVDKYGDFIRLGVDAFRVDTVKHISRLTMNKYLIPGLYEIAKKCGNTNFFMFGEVCNRERGVWNHNIGSDSACFYTWKESKEYAWGDRKTNEASTEENWNDNINPSAHPTSNNVYLGNNYTYHTPDYSKSNGFGVIDFAMHWNFKYANDAYQVARQNDNVYNDATYNIVYVDSHDYAPDGNPEEVRYNQGTDAWKENMSLMFTFRGVPCVYYGSEIEFMKGKKIDQYQNLSNSGRAYYGDYLQGTVNATGFGSYTASGEVEKTLNSTLSKHLMMLNKIRLKVPALSMGQYSAFDNMAFVRRYTNGNIDSLAAVAISNSTTFNGLPNGNYVNLVTGERKPVNNGTLSVSVGEKGSLAVFVLENAYTGTLTKIS